MVDTSSGNDSQVGNVDGYQLVTMVDGNVSASNSCLVNSCLSRS